MRPPAGVAEVFRSHELRGSASAGPSLVFPHDDMSDDANAHRSRECAFCGGTMRLRVAETVVQIPGNPKPSSHTVREWVCPDCDNYEEDTDET